MSNPDCPTCKGKGHLGVPAKGTPYYRLCDPWEFEPCPICKDGTDKMWTQETETYPINDDPVAQRS